MQSVPAARPVLVAPDSFKGTLTAAQVADALERGLRGAGWRCDRCPAADGGDGTLDVLLGTLGGELVETDAHDPLGRPIRASFAMIDGARAVPDVPKPLRDRLGCGLLGRAGGVERGSSAGQMCCKRRRMGAAGPVCSSV